MPKIAIIANTKSRSGSGWATCEPLLRGRSNFKVYPIIDTSVDSLVTTALKDGSLSIIAAGGDGTVSAVVNALIKQDILAKFGVLPLGTFNHFAKDLTLPLNPKDALEVIQQGHTRLIDVGMVNDTYFVNNSSVGAYPHFVEEREALQKRGTHKALAQFRAAVSLLKKQPSFTLRFGFTDSQSEKRALGIFVGNNRYSVDGMSLGSRAKLDEATLFVALLKYISSAGFIHILIAALRGNTAAKRELDVIGLHECVIDSTKHDILVSCDGEISRMRTPLRYSIKPKALTVIVPSL